MPRKVRLDLHLLTKGLAASRQQAQQLIRAGKVRDQNGKLLDKPGLEVPDSLVLKIQEAPRFVSRGGEKLFGALSAFLIDVEGKVCLDCGISTGGFADCLLQNGAARVYGIDVGYGQTAWNIRNDSRVVLHERTNIRKLTADQFYKDDDPLPDLVVADLSFISLRLVLPAIKSLVKPFCSEALLLVKPQFEVGRDRVGKGGVVKDIAAHEDALKSVMNYSLSQGWYIKGLIPAVIKGAAGNQEYFLWLGLNDKKDLKLLEIEEVIRKTFC